MRLAIVWLLATSTLAHAEPRVAVIERDKLEERGGIARFAALRAQLERERPTFRPAESPGGTGMRIPTFCEQPDKEFKRACDELKKSDATQRVEAAWQLHEAEVLAPLRAEVAKAIAGFAKSRGIELLLEKTELEIVYLAPGVDVTDAFIKDFNTRYPAVKR